METLKQPLQWEAVAHAVAGQRVGAKVVYLAEVGSTNDVARELATQGEAEGTVVVADSQTSGRGRAGKSRWLTPPNTSIAVSIVLRPEMAPEQLPVLAALAGVAVVEAIRGMVEVPVELKWPNDLLARGRKVGGILVESSIAAGRVAFAIVGIGLNVNLPASALDGLPDAAIPATTVMAEVGQPVSREALLIALLREFDAHYGSVRNRAFEHVWSAYRRWLTTLGRAVRVGTGEEVVEGHAEDVLADGSLAVRLATGERRAFSYGEVTVRDALRSAPHSGA